MNISKTCNLILSDLFLYDFRSCFYNILENIGWNLSKIEYNDKTKRNIQLGYLQKNNPSLGKFLSETSKNLIHHYIKINNLDEKDIIIVQKDGMIITKKLSIFDDTQPIELRGIISKLIISSDRKKTLAIFDDGTVEIKGISNKTVDVSFYNAFKNLDFSRKKSLVKALEHLRQSIMNSNKILWFARKTEENMYIIPIIGEGNLKVSPSAVNNIDPSEIDKSQIWDELIWPFCRSILIHYHS